ncbi:MAG: DNA polymerase III subunit gamma/tau [Clostridia bacterium]|nr:DNA polymerase III subunit gamma/tau [Clostridia bacterium]
MHQALYRKYRPSDFSKVVGQEHITSVLRYEVAEGKTSHAYLFCGSRGTGKTTCAKILSKAVNCLAPIEGNPCCQCENCLAIEKGRTTDVMEMDAASNTGVDYIRDIRDAVMYAPSMLSTRVYIIDEVHMLSDGAFNALLKTLEEPPSNVIFILATTEMQKIPATILSRCQRFEFRRIAGAVIAERLMHIAEEEGLTLEKEAAHLIARLAQGGMRDAISMLELCGAEGKRIDRALVEALSGGAGRQMVEKTVDALAAKDKAALFAIIAKLFESSGDLSVFWQELIGYYRDMIVVKTVKNMENDALREDILDLTQSEYEKLLAHAEKFRYETLMYHCSVLDGALSATSGKSGVSGRIAAELALMKMSCENVQTTPEALLARIAALEDKINGGLITVASSFSPEGGQPKKEPAATEVQSSSFAEAAAVKQAKEMPSFIEVVQAYARLEPGTAAFLNDARAYLVDDSTVEVVLSSDFALKMLTANGAEKALCAIIRNTQGMAVQVRFTLNNAYEGASKSVDALDELS